MNRRGFFKGLIAVAGAAVARRLPSTITLPSPEPIVAYVGEYADFGDWPAWPELSALAEELASRAAKTIDALAEMK